MTPGVPATREAPWWPDSAAPSVSSVEGVEVDEPGPESSLPPVNEPADETPESAGPDDEA